MTHRILIVEDEPSIAELIAINLTHAGFDVDRAFQTDQASNMMREVLPNLLILDWMLPGKSGVQFAKELRLNERTKALPILLLTAKSEEADKILGLDSGADDYVTKPFSPKELVARVKALLLLQFLMANPERVHSRASLLDRVWGNEVYIEERTVDVHIKRLRAALAPAGCDNLVETVRGSGYRITKSPV